VKEEKMPRIIIVILSGLLLISAVAHANYGRRLCGRRGYVCIRAKAGDSWSRLFPNRREQQIVRRINRTNTRLRRGMIIAVPKNLYSISHMEVSPFPHQIEPRGRRILLINLRLQAFGAYDEYGRLLHWGPVSAGKGWCPDVGRRCGTPRGIFSIHSKGGPGCVSSKYPVGRGGAPMPYCMFFYKGFAMHGSFLPGYHASHGCIRMFTEDARWLNRHFTRRGRGGTLVIIR
jgi:hypothetical protein